MFKPEKGIFRWYPKWYDDYLLRMYLERLKSPCLVGVIWHAAYNALDVNIFTNGLNKIMAFEIFCYVERKDKCSSQGI